jgi:hypothetical protein
MSLQDDDDEEEEGEEEDEKDDDGNDELIAGDDDADLPNLLRSVNHHTSIIHLQSPNARVHSIRVLTLVQCAPIAFSQRYFC